MSTSLSPAEIPQRIIRHAMISDMAEILSVIEAAKGIMRHSGNLNQWSDSYPGPDIINEDISRSCGYVIEDDCGVTRKTLCRKKESKAYLCEKDTTWIY